MSYALKRKFPKIYKFLKKFEKNIPASTLLWDKKKYKLNLKIISMLNAWKSWPRLKTEAKVVFDMYEGGDFIDIGAYHGVYSFLLAPKAKNSDTFLSCEPDPDATKDLIENLDVLKGVFKHIKFQITFEPIGDGRSVIRNPTIYGHPVYSNQKDKIDSVNIKEKVLKSIQLDNLVEKFKLNPSFVKIDVEGAEYDVLQGMSSVFKVYKPLIMLEKHPTLIPKDISIDDINNFLDTKGYKVESVIFRDDIAITEIWKKYN